MSSVCLLIQLSPTKSIATSTSYESTTCSVSNCATARRVFSDTREEADDECIAFIAEFTDLVPDPSSSCVGNITGCGNGFCWFNAGNYSVPNSNPYTVINGQFRYGSCPYGYSFDSGFGCLDTEDDQGYQCPISTAKPINTGSGNKYHQEEIEVSDNEMLRYTERVTQ